MKARVKATGEIVNLYDNDVVLADNDTDEYLLKELDFNVDSPDYWTRLEHQYAGMAMQGILSNSSTPKSELKAGLGIIQDALWFATALVEKMKEKEEKK